MGLDSTRIPHSGHIQETAERQVGVDLELLLFDGGYEKQRQGDQWVFGWRTERITERFDLSLHPSPVPTPRYHQGRGWQGGTVSCAG